MGCACFRVFTFFSDLHRLQLTVTYNMPPKAKGKKFGARKMPPPLPKGEVLTDSVKKQQWVIGASIGTGGFGEIYIAAQKGRDLANAEHVIKIVSYDAHLLMEGWANLV